MTVKAKFVCYSVEPHGNSDASTVRMGPVCRGIENAEWAAATPSGSLQMTVLNTGAVAQFVQGEEYLLTFEHAPKPTAGDGHAIDPVTNKQGFTLCAFCGAYLSKQEYPGDGKPPVIVRNDEAYKTHAEMFGEPGASADAPSE